MESSDSVKQLEVLMDTPVRANTATTTTTTAPPPKFEESPVFNFLNNLSPIKMVKSVHISQTINSLNFTSIPSIFTSPHVASLKESRFLRRHQLGDPSKPEFSSEDVSKVDMTGKTDMVPDSKNKENVTSQRTIEESKDPPYESCNSPNYNFGSLNSNQITPPSGLRTKLESESDGSSGALVLYVQEDCDSFHETEMAMEGSSQIGENKEDSGCDWDKLISDAVDLLDFASPNDAEAVNKRMDPDTRFYPLTSNDMESSGILVGPSGQHDEGNDSENHFTERGDGSESNSSTANPNMNGDSSQSINAADGGPINLLVHETVSNLYRGMRRRCLDFELSGVRKKHLPETSESDSPILPQSDGNCKAISNQSIPAEFRNESSRCVLPGIGLHLNSLAATSKDYKVVKNESSSSGKQLVIAPGFASNRHLLNNSQVSVGEAVDVSQSDIQIVLLENRGSILQDSVHVSEYMVNEEYNQTSPKKKRRRSESGEGEACKRCNCKKSKCLKLYCECFAAGLYCVEPCSCIDCFNKYSHEDTVLATRDQIISRNPLAFAPKVIKNSDRLSEAGEDASKTPASARHKRGCKCKKSGCLKKYCECFQGGVGCSINCRCEGCKNAFGRKYGSEIELEEVDSTQKSVIDRSQQRSLIQVDTEQNLDYVNPATPVPFCRNMYHVSVPSKNKPPRSSLLPVGSSSAVYTSQEFVKPDFHQPPSKFDNNFGLLQGEDIPMVLQTNGSPISGTKSSSPNGKRVSSPHSVHETLPGQRSSRKLILQSIPSFPSLTPKNDSGATSSKPENVCFAKLH